MNPAAFYDDPQKQKELDAVALTLLGTPFGAHAMVPGAAIDCIHVNIWCYRWTRFLAELELPSYSLDTGAHAAQSQLLAWLDACPKFAVITFIPGKPEAIARPGDTLCFNLGLSEHHVGLVRLSQQFVHVLPKPGRAVIQSALTEPYYRRRVTAIYRPLAT